MAVQRKKSLADLRDQRARILEGIRVRSLGADPWERSTLNKRADRVNMAWSKYNRNIARTKGYALKPKENRHIDTVAGAYNISMKKIDAKRKGDTALVDKLDRQLNKKYSRSTYMGLSKG